MTPTPSRWPLLLSAIALLAVAGPAPAQSTKSDSRQGRAILDVSYEREQVEPALSEAMHGLRDDERQGNAAQGYALLYAADSRAYHLLRDGLESEDWQQRLLSAALLSRLEPREEDFDLCARILLSHLEDNAFRGDATLAGRALYELGWPANKYLFHAGWRRDGQFGDSCRLLRSCIGMKCEHPRESHGVGEQLVVDLRWLGRGPAQPPALAAQLPTLLELAERSLLDLGDDKIRGNANRAFYRLGRLIRSEEAIAEMAQHALFSPDPQRRRLVGAILMRDGAPPTTGLLLAAVEALGQDSFGSRKTLMVGNANIAATYLRKHKDVARSYLRGVLHSDDPSQVLRAAALLAQNQDPFPDDFFPILLEHLRDNEWGEDAVLAAQSIVMYGPKALYWLELESPDWQQERFLQIIRNGIYERQMDPKSELPFSNGGMYKLDWAKSQIR